MGRSSESREGGDPRGGSAPGYRGGRRIGAHRGERPGPLLVCVGGLHGNEPAGVEALRHVLRELGSGDAPTVGAGSFVALAGNLGALQASVRYRDRDLNRQWTDPRTDQLGGEERAGPGLGPECREQRRLLRILEETLEEDRRGPAYLVDLHTTSGESPPFGIVGRREACQRFAREFPMPQVRGMERHLPGMLADWACRRGFASFTAEAGQHVASASVDRHRAVIWTALAAAGLVADELPLVERARRLLTDASRGVPRRLEVDYRHPIVPGDGFRMRSGRKNFDFVRKGDVVADDRTGEITAPESGLLFLPLYQELGSDGFFLVRAPDSDAGSHERDDGDGRR